MTGGLGVAVSNPAIPTISPLQELSEGGLVLPAVGSDHGTGRLELHSQRATATAVKPITPRVTQRVRADVGTDVGEGAERARRRRSSAGIQRVRKAKLSDAQTGHCGSA